MDAVEGTAFVVTEFVKFAGVVLLVVGMFALATCAGTPAYAHDETILKCSNNLKVEKVKKLGEKLNPNGLLSEAYDRNNDGKIDIETLSYPSPYASPNGGPIVHSHHPIFYMVDLDYDGNPDALYVDKGPGGVCADVVLYETLKLDTNKDLRDGRTGS